ncbi:MAG: hypothetical protein IKT40_12820 [Bacilli bacterium]|nr:hypothetical protein [Bacilli bacterium]
MFKTYGLQLQLGVDLVIPELQIILHQPTLQEIAMTMLEEEEFFFAIGILTMDKAHLDNELSEPLNNFDIFMSTMNSLKSEEKNSVLLVLDLLFSMYEVKIVNTVFLLRLDGKNFCTINAENFDLIQEYIKLIFCVEKKDPDEIIYNTKGELANKIRDKIMRGREKVRELHREKNKEQSSNTIRRYVSILQIGAHINYNEIARYTLYQLYDAIERFNLYTNYDIDLRVRLAGGSPKEEVDEWTKQI